MTISRRQKLKDNYTDSDKLECKICGERFLQLTSKHLSKHNISAEEYKMKFNVDSLISPIAQQKKLNSIKNTENNLIRIAWNKGSTRSVEQNSTQSKTMLNKYKSGELVHWNVGNTWDDSIKEHISNTLKGHNYFDDEALNKRNKTIEDKIKNGWVSPLKGRPISDEHREKSIIPFTLANQRKTDKAIELIKEKIELNNLELINIENNYYITLKCLTCLHIFYNTKQVFNESKNNGKELCPICHPKNIVVSKLEIELRNFVCKLLPDEKIIYNDRTVLSGKEIDIFLPDRNIGLEFNGLYWHSTDENTHDYHILHKMQFAFKNGVRLITIFENEWLYSQDIVKSRLSHILHKTDNVIYARKTNIKEVPYNVCKEFLDKNHIQGNVNSSIRLGLYYGDKLISIMTFNKSRFDDSAEYELLRFCNILNMSVVGGSSKLLKYFINEYNPKSIVSYSDRRWNTGKLYKTLGFKYIHSSKPNYFYIESGSTQLLNRFNFQKYKLNDLLKNYDSSISEFQNMKNNGYRRIYDCGSSKWILNINID